MISGSHAYSFEYASDQVTGSHPAASFIPNADVITGRSTIGDYRDTRIRNSPAELDAYPEEFNELLDRILDEFGLVVCGWSAAWDSALRNAIFRARSRRFTTYWAVHGEATDQARRLIEHRRAQVIQIDDADGFFQTLNETVRSIETFSTPHPLSTAAAVSSLKRYLSEPRHRIQLADLIDDTVERVVGKTATADFGVEGADVPTTETVTARVRAYESACSTLMAMATIGGRWTERDHCDVWQRALQRFCLVSTASGNVLWVGLQRYPGTLLLYVLGLGAVEADNLAFLGRIFSTAIHQSHDDNKSVAELLAPFRLFWMYPQSIQILEGMGRRHAPLNDWLHTTIRQYTRRMIANDDQYTFIFDKFEILMALSVAYHARSRGEPTPHPPGAFGYRHESRRQVLQEITESISRHDDSSPFVQANIFGETAEDCMQHLGEFEQFVSRLDSMWR